MPDQTIKLAAVGDIALTHKYDQILYTKGPCYPFQPTKKILSENDIVIGNLESPLSLKGQNYPLKCSLRSNPLYIKGIKDAGFNILSVANNHILDYQEGAFYDTLSLLEEHGIGFSGAGKNLEDAAKPYIAQVNGIKIAFFAYCDVIIDSPFYAGINKRGIALLDLTLIKRDFAKYKNCVDIIIASLHWGTEHFSYPSPQQIKTAHTLVDWGASLIIGHHPHVIQSLERYRNAYIFYSLGNFLFSDIEWTWQNEKGEIRNSRIKRKRKNKESIIASATISKKGVESIQFIPCVINDNYQAEINYNSDILNRLNKLSERVNIKHYADFWVKYNLMQKYTSFICHNLKRLQSIHKLRLSHFRNLYETFIKAS